jgi:transcriptional regulator GlxA family with amidase domain
MAPRSVLIAVFDGVQSLDITGPLKVFAGANAWLARPGGPGTACPGAAGPAYQISVAGLGGGPVRTSSGLTLLPDADLRAAPAAHTLLVPGGDGSISANEELTAWLRRHAPAAQRIASVCTGAFLLARAGLLAGRKATTHWAYAGTME